MLKLLIVLVLIGLVVVAWRMRAEILGKILGQDPARVQRHLDRKRK
ncbi:hypothetical protein [Nocardioides sp. GY 10127]|nr:hypothetical protein [Nocardioides sp. GY 10127]